MQCCETMFIILLVLLMNANNMNVDVVTNLAIESIKDAEKNGADVSELIGRFNKANSLLMDECDEACMTNYNSMLESIINDAKILKEKNNEQRMMTSILVFGIYVPITVLGLSIVVVYIYNFVEEYNIRKFMNMEIEYKDDE